MRLMLTCAAAALLAAPAAAGPVAWTYHVEAVYAADYGSRFQINVAPGGRVVTETGPWDGTGHNLFGSTLDPRPLPGEYKAQYSFGVNVTITDAASGESATLPFGGWYSAEWSYPPEEANNPDAWRWDSEWSEFGHPFERTPVRLGNVLYLVGAHGGGQGSAPNGVLMVSAETVATPEPATLALAGVGLVPLLGRFTRKRLVPCA